MSATVGVVAAAAAAATAAVIVGVIIVLVDIGGHRGLSRHELMELDLATSVAES